MATKKITLTIEEEELEIITNYCINKNISKSKFIRECVNNSLKNDGIDLDIKKDKKPNLVLFERDIRNSILSYNSTKMLSILMEREKFSGSIKDFIERVLLDRFTSNGNEILNISRYPYSENNKIAVRSVSTLIHQTLIELDARQSLALNATRYFRRALDELRDIAESGEVKCFDRYKRVEEKAINSLNRFDDAISNLYEKTKSNILGGKRNEQHLIPSEQVQQGDK